MSKKWTFIIAVTGTVIGGLILHFVLKLNPITLLVNFFKWFFGLFAVKFTLPLWGLLLVAALPILIIAGIIYLVLRKEEKEEDEEPSFKDYVSDIVFGILWNWRYRSNTLDEHYLIPVCPKCKRQLHERDKYTMEFGSKFRMTCPNCDFKSDSFNGNLFNLKQSVIREIEGRLRSEEYKDKLKAQ